MGSTDLIYPCYTESRGEDEVVLHILEMQQSLRCISGCHAGSQRKGGKAV